MSPLAPRADADESSTDLDEQLAEARRRSKEVSERRDASQRKRDARIDTLHETANQAHQKTLTDGAITPEQLREFQRKLKQGEA